WQGTLPELLQKPDQMARWGIDIPPVVKLVDILQQSGIAVSHPIYTVSQFVKALKKLKDEN
ncbi:MAG: hypothetical protein AB1847_21030, partial [bacterium]